MKKRFLVVALLCGFVSLFITSCGNKDVENAMAEEPIVRETQEPIVSETQEPIVNETQEPIVNETQEPIVNETQEPIVNETKEPNSASSTSSTNSETSSSASESTSSSSSSSTGTSQSTSTPAPEQSSSSSVAPSNPSDGHISVSQGSTGKTSFGTEYPILSEFNKLALDANNTYWNNDDVPDEYTAAVGEANRALGKAVGSLEASGVAFTLDGTGCIISCGSAWVERQPSKGQYLFVYGCDFTALSDGGSLSREIIKVMLGTSVTSTPVEVEKALFEDCFGDNEQFPLNVWVACGDCEIKFVYSDDTRAEYAIRAKQ